MPNRPAVRLFNRAGLHDALVEIEAEAAASDQSALLIYLDLDRFKESMMLMVIASWRVRSGSFDQGVTAGLRHLLPKEAAFARIVVTNFAIALVCKDPGGALRGDRAGDHLVLS